MYEPVVNHGTGLLLQPLQIYRIGMVTPKDWTEIEVRTRLERDPPGLRAQGTFQVLEVTQDALDPAAAQYGKTLEWHFRGKWMGPPAILPDAWTITDQTSYVDPQREVPDLPPEEPAPTRWVWFPIGPPPLTVQRGNRYRFLVVAQGSWTLSAVQGTLSARGWALETTTPASASTMAILTKAQAATGGNQALQAWVFIARWQNPTGTLPKQETLPSAAGTAIGTLIYAPLEEERPVDPRVEGMWRSANEPPLPLPANAPAVSFRPVSGHSNVANAIVVGLVGFGIVGGLVWAAKHGAAWAERQGARR